MAVSNSKLTYHVPAGEDLSDSTKGSGAIYKAINVNSAMIASTGQSAVGLLTDGGPSGQNVTYAFFGILKYTAAATVALGASLTVTTSGFLTTATSGSFVVGQSLVATTSGSVATGMFNFANPFPVVNSNGVV